VNEDIGFEVQTEQRGFAWECRVWVGTPEEGVEHLVTVSRGELALLAPGEWEPTRLVEESFRFLLEREPASAILRKFAVSDIKRYFPDYPDQMAVRLGLAE
jgi:hypothetical protein